MTQLEDPEAYKAKIKAEIARLRALVYDENRSGQVESTTSLKRAAEHGSDEPDAKRTRKGSPTSPASVMTPAPGGSLGDRQAVRTADDEEDVHSAR